MDSRAPAILLAAALLGVFGTGTRCGTGPQVRIDSPVDTAVVTTDAVFASGVVGANFQTPTITVEVDGVDLVAALGLTPPFTGQGGSVLIGGNLVSVTNFRVSQTAPALVHRIEADLSGFVPGSYSLVVTGLNAVSQLATDQADFAVVDSFSQPAHALTAARLPADPFGLGTSMLVNASMGEAVVAQPIATASGGTIRSGHVERAEQLIAGGP